MSNYKNVLIYILLFTSFAFTNYSIKGTVYDDKTKETLIGASVFIEDHEVVDKLRIEIENLLSDKNTCKEMESALKAASRPDASIIIVDEIEKLLKL